LLSAGTRARPTAGQTTASKQREHHNKIIILFALTGGENGKA